MSRVFFELKDKGTSFWDASQTRGITVDRVEALELTANVIKAEREGTLIRVPMAEGKKRYEQQKLDIKKQRKADRERAKNQDLDEDDLDDLLDEETEEEETEANPTGGPKKPPVPPKKA